MKHLWFNETLSKASDEKRVHHQLFPMMVEYEEGFDLEVSKIYRMDLATLHNVDNPVY